MVFLMARVWLVRTSRALDELLEKGYLRGKAEHVLPDFKYPYDWMREQLREKVGPGPRGAYPVWVWYQYSNESKRRPDLRHRALLPTGSQGVRFELEVPDEALLLSDFELWHLPLNGWYVPSSVEDGERFDDLFPHRSTPRQRKRIQKEIEKSWERVLDLDFSAPDIASPRSEKSIQGVIWEITLEQVVSVDTFIGR